MTIWLYTEDAEPLRAGPFESIDEAADSLLWERFGVCVWIEERTPGGWAYENACWIEMGWATTSKGVRPSEPFRPSFLLEAKEAA